MFKVGDKIIWWFKDSSYGKPYNRETFFELYGKGNYFEVVSATRSVLNTNRETWVDPRGQRHYEVHTFLPESKGISAFIKRVEKEYSK
jgi:hypothetical protein